jgi:hypothetical protein
MNELEKLEKDIMERTTDCDICDLIVEEGKDTSDLPINVCERCNKEMNTFQLLLLSRLDHISRVLNSMNDSYDSEHGLK